MSDTPSIGPKRSENSSSVSSPRSSRRSSASATGSSRKRRFTASGSSPSFSQNALNESKTFVVRTPPKSTRRPFHEREIWSAASASAGTPSTKRPRYSSSEAPAWKRFRFPSMNTAAFQSASAWYQLSADIERPVRSS